MCKRFTTNWTCTRRAGSRVQRYGSQQRALVNISEPHSDVREVEGGDLLVKYDSLDRGIHSWTEHEEAKSHDDDHGYALGTLERR